MLLIIELRRKVIKAQLAHANGGSVRGIYNHAQYLDKRREMMQWWADWIDGDVT
ncbi:integrase [Escherichia coli]|nr:integrase [Escherichia coli]EFC6628353.1 integrase [Escherichia coli]EFH5535146.1 integrase [Escherichia coli]EFN5083201.1 integrase [Escherichia coli]EFO0663554.1 integrase [Escherichia coli]